MRIQLNTAIPKEFQREAYKKNREELGIICKKSGIQSIKNIASATFSMYTTPQGVEFCQREEVETFYIAYSCDSCGMEFYGEWELLALDGFYKPPYNMDNYLPDLIYDSELKIELKRMVNEADKRSYWRDDIADDVRRINNMEVCPCCGKRINRKPGYYIIPNKPYQFDLLSSIEGLKKTVTEYVPSHFTTIDGRYRSSGIWKSSKFYDIEELYCELKRDRNYFEEKEADEKVRGYRTICDVPVVLNVQAEKVQAIKNDPDKLKEYIFDLVKIEANIYSLEKRLLQLYYQKKEYDRKANFAIYSPQIKQKQEVLEAESNYNNYVNIYKKYQAGIFPFEKPIKPSEPVASVEMVANAVGSLIGGLLNRKKATIDNGRFQSKYEDDLRIYNEALQQYEEKKKRLLMNAENNIQKAKSIWEGLKQRENAFTPESNDNLPEIHLKELLDNEILSAETLLKETYKCRNELYSLNIVFEKYRNPVALATFYEYLMSGRCTSLEGANGAYNIYEQEVRADIIIDKLDKIIISLDQIKNNQYMIYQELCTINQNLDRLNKTVSEISDTVKSIDKTTREIEYNTAATAYYSKINAELTNSLGFMMALS